MGHVKLSLFPQGRSHTLQHDCPFDVYIIHIVHVNYCTLVVSVARQQSVGQAQLIQGVYSNALEGTCHTIMLALGHLCLLGCLGGGL